MTKKFLAGALLTGALLLGFAKAQAQGVKPLPSLHVEGRWLVDTHGNHVVLHGVMDTPNMYFNGYRWGSPWDGTGYNSNSVTKCLNYFEKCFAAYEQANCTVFRLHLDPAWTNDPSSTYTYAVAKDQPADATSEADISKFNPSRLKSFLTTLYWQLMKKAIDHRQYVVVRPPGVCPHNLKVGDYYQQYLLEVWDIVTQNSNIKKNAGQISLELANEPVSVKNANGQDDAKALHDYFQPIVDKIRENGFTGIIWIPGTGWQANYESYASWPIEGYNIGYAVHDYNGWYGCDDKQITTSNRAQKATNLITQFKKQVPVVDTNPIIISEVDWSPEDPNREGHYDEHGNWVIPNLGTWATGRTSMWGYCYKQMIDHYGNISMTLTHPHEFIDLDQLMKDGSIVPAFGGNPEACGKACMDWYAEYYNVDWAHADFANSFVSDQGNGRYKNPVVYADFPDPDVIRVDNTYYMVSTTMHHFPGATILKSKDLVNWEYCSQPLAELATTDNYSLENGQDAYGSGMWACSMKYHNGQFYLLINGNDAGGWLLTATNPEGKWEKKKLSRIYYDPGMLFDNGKVYIACGITNIQMCELDENFNFIKEQRVISDVDGLEGSHLYKIGDYYYIYATNGGWPSGQSVYRSKNIFGPYEGKVVLQKMINNKVNTIHQGALIDTPEGEWWTILQEDIGALGRVPNLQPVKWVDDWPVIGNNGIPVAATGTTSTYTKPKTSAQPRKALPTNDNFRSYPLGMQWEWNHNPVNGAWSLFERPGWLRMRTTGKADRLTQAKNMLTQRIFVMHGKEAQETKGTVRIDVSALAEGDRAGICIFQDPYAYVAVEKKDGKLQIVWRQDQLRTNEGFTPEEQTAEVAGITDGIVYLRAAITKNTNKTKFYYSTDNETYTQIGKETELKFNLSVFVGSRFGLFCMATQDGSNGYADFDWFSTEDTYDEAMYYPADFAGYSEEMLTAVKLTLSAVASEVMVGNSGQLDVTATYQDGHTENVASQCRYEIDGGGAVEIRNGRLFGMSEGTANVSVFYTDPLGHELTEQFTVRSTFFPFGTQYIKTDFFSNGTYTESTHTFKPGQYGQMGWQYTNGADMSGYKYLVIKLGATSSDSHLNIFTENSIWSSCCATSDFGTKKQIVVDLTTAKYTSGDKQNQKLDTKNIHIVCFWGSGSKSIKVDEMYLTNNSDYSPETPTAITSTHYAPLNTREAYDLMGRQVGANRRGLVIVRTSDGQVHKTFNK